MGPGRATEQDGRGKTLPFKQRLWWIKPNRTSASGVVPSRQQWGQVGILGWAGWVSDRTDKNAYFEARLSSFNTIM